MERQTYEFYFKLNLNFVEWDELFKSSKAVSDYSVEFRQGTFGFIVDYKGQLKKIWTIVSSTRSTFKNYNIKFY